MVGGKEEAEEEVSAAEAVYGEECVVVDKYPPHLHLHLKPRTADVSSQQFVEAVIGIRAGPQYPEEPPHISIIDSKGLDEQRQKYLITTIRKKASELTSYQMLIALCEEAVEQLSNMNHPDGDCPLCLTPLVDEDGSNKSLPFMKLMSCFHCFHGECISRWWNWLQLQNESDSSRATSSSGQAQEQRGIQEKSVGRCPVCRKVFLAKDIEHVLDLVGTNTSLDDSGSKLDDDDDEKILHSDSEVIRRQKFEAILKIQQEKSGLIEPKRNEVLLPGMYLPRPVVSPMEVVDTETAEEPRKHLAANSKSDMHVKPSSPSSSNSRSQRTRNTSSRRNKAPPFEHNRKEKEANTRSASSKPSTSKDRNATARPDKGVNPKPQVRRWIRKENDPTS